MASQFSLYRAAYENVSSDPEWSNLSDAKQEQVLSEEVIERNKTANIQLDIEFLEKGVAPSLMRRVIESFEEK